MRQLELRQPWRVRVSFSISYFPTTMRTNITHMSTLTNHAHTDNFQPMKITNRNMDIVARHVAGETLSAIAKSLDISRARAHKIFKDHATPADRAARDKPKPMPEPVTDPDFPKDEDRVRIHVPAAKSTEIKQREVRAGIRRWLAGEFPITDEIETSNRERMDAVVASSMHIRLAVRCADLNIPIATAVRGIIDYLENEDAQDHQ